MTCFGARSLKHVAFKAQVLRRFQLKRNSVCPTSIMRNPWDETDGLFIGLSGSGSGVFLPATVRPFDASSIDFISRDRACLSAGMYLQVCAA
jgi:hypothetical protein